MKIDLAPPPGHRSGGRRSRTALIWLLHLRVTAQEGRGQIDLAPPPHLRGSLLHGDWEVEQPCFLVGNNQLTSPTPYTLYYYLPELVMVRAASRAAFKASPCLYKVKHTCFNIYWTYMHILDVPVDRPLDACFTKVYKFVMVTPARRCL